MSVLEKVNAPQDVKKLTLEELKELAQDVREAVLNKVSQTGGHVGPNLGIVEATIAMHYVFDSPKDKIVFDVSHQSYPHKILTGRKDGFIENDHLGRWSGYTNPEESPHDFFKVGHTSTSVSLACGLAKARDIRNEKSNIIAVIGDGSLSGGEALEGLNNAAVLGSNMIIVVNDNEMSIAENHGGLYTALRTLRQSNGAAENNWFKALGFKYHYVADGNNLADLINVFKQVKDTPCPTVVHIHTLKGKGLLFAEKDKESWHWKVPFDIKTGALKYDLSGESYQSVTAKHLIERVQKDKTIVVVNAGTPGAVGLGPKEREALGENFVDVGIAEGHAVAMTSALAKGGCKPVYLCLSSFIQRTYDQLSQDLAINNNPAVIVIFYGSMAALNDVTHLGIFDIPLISNIPNIQYLTPTCKEEYLAMLDYGINQTERPVVIRAPMDIAAPQVAVEADYAKAGYQVVEQGSKVALLAVGDFLELGRAAAEALKHKGITPTLINPRTVTELDERTLEALKQNHILTATLEDGVVDGGFGEKIARYYGADKMKVLCFGAKKAFTDRVPADELHKRYHLTPEQISADILNALD